MVNRHCRLSLVAVLTFLLLLTTALSRRGPHLRSPRKEEEEERAVVTRQLIGPGSSPPTCRSRCSTCSPCRPVHVAIHPGLFSPLDYYPEAWRCTCGHKLFLP